MGTLMPFAKTSGRPMAMPSQAMPSQVLNGNATKLSRTVTWALAMALALAVCQSKNARAADAANGEVIAARWCNACHLASSRQQGGSDLAPPFASIANDATLTPEGLRVALSGRHPRMPDFSLARQQIDDLSAYLRTLRK
jgi:mono/diheme cytochrome c family protein